MSSDSPIEDIPMLAEQKRIRKFRLPIFNNNNKNTKNVKENTSSCDEIHEIQEENEELQRMLRAVTITRDDIHPSRMGTPIRVECLHTPISDTKNIPRCRSPGTPTGPPIPMRDEDAKVIADDLTGNVNFDTMVWEDDAVESKAVVRDLLPFHLEYTYPSSKTDTIKLILKRLMKYKCNKRLLKRKLLGIRLSALKEAIDSNICWRKNISSYQNVEVNALPKISRLVWQDVDTLSDYLKKHHSKINKKDDFKRTALHFAASWGDIRMVDLLLTINDIKLNLEDHQNETPIVKAIQANSVQCVMQLVEGGANWHAIFNNVNLLEYTITTFGDDALAISMYLYRIFLSKGVGNSGNSLIHLIAATWRNVPVLKTLEMLLLYGENPRVLDSRGRTTLDVALQHDREDVVKVLQQYVPRERLDVRLVPNIMERVLRNNGFFEASRNELLM